MKETTFNFSNWSIWRLKWVVGHPVLQNRCELWRSCDSNETLISTLLCRIKLKFSFILVKAFQFPASYFTNQPHVTSTHYSVKHQNWCIPCSLTCIPTWLTRKPFSQRPNRLRPLRNGTGGKGDRALSHDALRVGSILLGVQTGRNPFLWKDTHDSKQYLLATFGCGWQRRCSLPNETHEVTTELWKSRSLNEWLILFWAPCKRWWSLDWLQRQRIDFGQRRTTFTFWISVYSFCQIPSGINYSSVSHPICSTFIKEPSACSSHPVRLASSF